MTEKITREDIEVYLEENIGETKDVVREIISYNGDLDHLDVHDNDEDFFEAFYSGDVNGAVRAISFGEYNYNDTYVRINAYGNLETLNEWDLENEIQDQISDIVDSLIDNWGSISLSHELEELLNDYENSDEEEEEEEEE